MNSNNKDSSISSNPHVGDLLPGYIDNSLPDTELAIVRAHLDTCDACRADYVDLRATRAMLQQMPVVPTPRSFVLTEEMARRARKPSLLERILSPRLAPTFAGGSVLAFVLLVFLFATSTTSVSVSAPQVMSGLVAHATESSAPVDGARLAPDTAPQANEFSPGVIATTAAGEAPTALALGAAPNNNAAPAPVTPDTSAVTNAQSLPEGTPYYYLPSTKATDSTTIASGLANEPGVTAYSGNYTTTPPVSGTSILELGLLALGIALAAAAIIARLRA